MIDPITAFATAQAAIKGVQAAIKMGKDIHSCTGDLMKFFEAKDVVAKEAANPKKKGFGGSDTAKAFEIVMQAKQLADAEKQLREMLIWGGHADVWEAILRERNSMVMQRKSDELVDTKKRAKRKREIDEAIVMILAMLTLATFLTLVAWGTIELSKA